jgi:hypothetical protein
MAAKEADADNDAAPFTSPPVTAAAVKVAVADNEEAVPLTRFAETDSIAEASREEAPSFFTVPETDT